MASARRTVVLPVPPASPDAAARQSWSARPKQGSEPRSGPPGARVEAAPKAALAEGDHGGRRGLSVAQTARASPIAFRPLRRRPEVAPAAPPPPAEPLAGVTPRRVEPRARFVKTVAELERSQAAATGREEPGARIVPRPALARPEQGAAAGSPWTRLWPRRKGSAAG